MRTVFLALGLFIASTLPALAASPHNTYTYNTAFAVPEQSYQLAATWFLPDWQAGLVSRTDTAPAGSGDPSLSDSACLTTYNLFSACIAPQTIKKTYNFGKLTCYDCVCPSSYQYTSSNCSNGYTLAGGSCNGKYLRCDAKACPSGYTAGKTCASGYDREVSGKSGSQDCARCVAKGCPSGYSAGLSNCNGQSYTEGWTYSSNGYAGNSICGKCTAKSCAPGYTAGLANCNGQSQPSGWTYVSNGYAGNSVCGKCTAKSCPAGYSAGVTQCSNTTSWTYGSNGYAGNSICGKCTSKDCASGYTAGLANCNGKAHPAGWSYTAGTPSGNTVCGKCTAKSCTAGSTSCNSSTQNATANGYYAGDSVCYTCVAKTCEQMGQKTCNGSCIATSECCGGCPAGHECNDGTCIQTKCEAGYIFYSDGTCNSDYLADKTPVGIVADPEHRLLIDLKGINNISLLATISNINIPMIGNEYTRPISFNGYSNTTILARYTPAATTCLTKNRDGIMNNWYIPGSGEILSVGKNYQAVYAGLNKLADYGLADPNLGYLWSSDEVYSSDELGLVMNPADRQLTARPRMAMAANLRCMAHYLCSAASGCELPCPFESSGDSSNGVNGYTRKSISCDDGWLVQSYPFNSACKRCINDTVEGSSSGGNQPGKTECQVLDSMYYSNGKYFCTTAASANGTYMGKIGKKGLVILGQIGSTMSVSDAEQQCNNYTRGTFSNWRIVYTSDSDKWSSIICNVCHPFGKSGSLSMYYGGYGWNTATSYDRNGTLYCTHSYSNVYRE